MRVWGGVFDPGEQGPTLGRAQVAPREVGAAASRGLAQRQARVKATGSAGWAPVSLWGQPDGAGRGGGDRGPFSAARGTTGGDGPEYTRAGTLQQEGL